MQGEERFQHFGKMLNLIMRFIAVSQLLWPGKDREEWFSLEENHEKVRGFGLHQLRNRFSAGLEKSQG